MSRVLMVVLGLVAVLLFGLGFSACSWYNDAVSLEESVKAQYSNNKNEYDSFWKKVKETAQVPDKYKEDFKDLLVSETKSKYGPEGSKAMFQWFKDRDVNFDGKLYEKVQDVIESGRNDFKREQTELLDKQRKYEVHLRNASGVFYSHLFSMPSPVGGELAPPKDLDGDGRLTVLDYPIVTSKRTNDAFNNGEDEQVNVFGK